MACFQLALGSRIYDPPPLSQAELAWKVTKRLGLRREAKRHAAFERTEAFGGSLVCRLLESAFAVVLPAQSKARL
jgi:hypothetical protein